MHLCIFSCMIVDPDLCAEALAIARQARAAGIRQADLAMATGSSQPQISRILRGQLSRRSRLFEEISVYVRSASTGVSPGAVRRNEELINALAVTWDGTSQHAIALAAVIRSLGALQKAGLLVQAQKSRRGEKC